jgi:hypothetical protein
MPNRRCKIDKEERIRRRKEATKRKRNYIIEYKRTHPCSRCGEKDIRCLSFHHRVPKNKRFAVDSSAARRYSLHSIIAAIKKCDVLCLNCHAKVHNGNGDDKKRGKHKGKKF